MINTPHSLFRVLDKPFLFQFHNNRYLPYWDPVYPGSVQLSSYMEYFLPNSCAYCGVHWVSSGPAVWLCGCGGYRWDGVNFPPSSPYSAVLCICGSAGFVTPPVTSPSVCYCWAALAVSRLSLQTPLTPKASRLHWTGTQMRQLTQGDQRVVNSSKTWGKRKRMQGHYLLWHLSSQLVIRCWGPASLDIWLLMGSRK